MKIKYKRLLKPTLLLTLSIIGLVFILILNSRTPKLEAFEIAMIIWAILPIITSSYLLVIVIYKDIVKYFRNRNKVRRIRKSFKRCERASKRLHFEKSMRIFIEENEHVTIFNYLYYRYINKSWYNRK